MASPQEGKWGPEVDSALHLQLQNPIIMSICVFDVINILLFEHMFVKIGF